MRHKIVLSLTIPFLILLGLANYYAPKLLEKSPIQMFLLIAIPGCLLAKEIYSAGTQKEQGAIQPVSAPPKTVSAWKYVMAFLVPFVFIAIYLGPTSYAAGSYVGMLLLGTIAGIVGAITVMPSSRLPKTLHEGLDNSIMTGIILSFVIFILLPLLYLALHFCGFPMRANCRIGF